MGWPKDSKAKIDIVLGLFIALLNIFEIYLLTRMRRRRKLNNYELVLLSLSVADMLFGLSNVCVGISFFASTVHEEVFEVTVTTYFFFILTSMLHLTWITIDRLWAVYSPMKHNYQVTRKRINILLLLTWICTIFVSLFLILHDELIVEKGKPESDAGTNGTETTGEHISRYQRDIEITLSSFLIGINSIFVVSYSFLIYTLLRKRTLNNTNKQQHASVQTRLISNEARIAITCALIAVAFLCFTLPFAIEVFVTSKSSDSTSLLLQLNSAANSVIYFLRNNMDLCGKSGKQGNGSSAGNSTQVTPIQRRKDANDNLRMQAMKNSAQCI